jgi:hypothetical protein
MAKKHLVVCIFNEGYAAALETRKLYMSIPDPEAEKDGLIRVVDESGEDYAYPKSWFLPADELKPSVKRRVLASIAASVSA